MSIEEVTKYRTLGKEFDSMEKALQYRYDRVGEFMDSALGAWHPGQKIALVNFLTDNRRNVIRLLDY